MIYFCHSIPTKGYNSTSSIKLMTMQSWAPGTNSCRSNFYYFRKKFGVTWRVVKKGFTQKYWQYFSLKETGVTTTKERRILLHFWQFRWVVLYPFMIYCSNRLFYWTFFRLWRIVNLPEIWVFWYFSLSFDKIIKFS